MWLTYIENKETLSSIYKNKIPNINNVFLKEIIISTGEDLGIVLVFDIEDLPDDIPAKWIVGKVNTVQITLNLLATEINQIGLNKRNYKNLNLDISLSEMGSKRIIATDNSGKAVFEFESNWIYFKSITGYSNEKATK